MRFCLHDGSHTSPHSNHVIHELFLFLRANTKYTVNVFGMFEGGESMPLAGQERTTLSDGPEPPPYRPSGTLTFYCQTFKILT